MLNLTGVDCPHMALKISPYEVVHTVEELADEVGEMRSEIWQWYWSVHKQGRKVFPGWTKALKEMRKAASKSEEKG
jgi:hypothetical protein